MNEHEEIKIIKKCPKCSKITTKEVGRFGQYVFTQIRCDNCGYADDNKEEYDETIDYRSLYVD